jgi:acid phosphatase family membrane protein YuiD
MFTPSPGDIPYKAYIAVLTAWGLAALAKIIWQYYKGEPITFFTLGGMPSVHASLVGSLFLSIYYETGFSILLLAVGVFGGLVFRDAWGVRWEVSRHSIALNKLMATKDYERTGHTKLEAAAGIVFGFVVTVAVYAIL